MKDSSPTTKAIKSCAEWLHYCLEIGWQKDQLDGLEKIWWEHHDEKGNLIPKPSKESQKKLLIEMMKEDEKNGMYERTAEEILKAKLKNIHFIGSDETYALVLAAMEEYRSLPAVEQGLSAETILEKYEQCWFNDDDEMENETSYIKWGEALKAMQEFANIKLHK